MPRSTAATLAALAGLAVAAASGCVDRAIHEGICGDGRLSALLRIRRQQKERLG